MYLYNVTMGKIWGVDVEGDPIPSSQVYLCCCINAETGERVALRTYPEIRQWFEDRIAEGCTFVAHNGIGYDFPTLNRLVGTKITPRSIIDTNVMSQVYNPSIKAPKKMALLPPDQRKGPHSLKAWGFRVGIPKIDFDDFTSGWSPEMEEYCFRDTEICLEIYKRLAIRLRDKGFTDTALDVEHKAWAVIQQQKKTGFYFNLPEAHHLYNKLREMEKELEGRVNEYWPPEYQVVFTGQQAYCKDGRNHANFARHLEQYPEVRVHDELHSEWKRRYDCYDYVYFDIGSPVQRREKLLDLGWEPREFTDTGLAKPTDKGQLVPSLVEFIEKTGNDQVQLIADWMEINSRANMINTWIEACSDEDQCIHGSLFLANTMRYKHSGPNTANIPGLRMKKDENGEEHPVKGRAGAFTYESRDLWTCRPGKRRLVGVDAKGIQLRVLAHHLGNPIFRNSVLSSDPHTANQKEFNLPSRALTKTITYALVMGAGDPRIASEAKVSLKEAKASKALFFEKIPEFPKLINRLKNRQEATGRIELCSGMPLLVPESRLVIPYLLQGDESQIMKKAMWDIYLTCAKRGIDAKQVGMIHDEMQFDVDEDQVDEFIEICLQAFIDAGEFFNYSLPIEGDAKVGRTWSETH